MRLKKLLLVLLVLMAGGVVFALTTWNVLKNQEDLDLDA